MNRRGFLESIIAAAAAPAIVRADSLMKIIVPPAPVYHTGGIVLGSGRLWIDPLCERMEPIDLAMKRVRQYELAEFEVYVTMQIARSLAINYEELSHDLASRPFARLNLNRPST